MELYRIRIPSIGNISARVCSAQVIYTFYFTNIPEITIKNSKLMVYSKSQGKNSVYDNNITYNLVVIINNATTHTP
jgi:hypothetical protein